MHPCNSRSPYICCLLCSSLPLLRCILAMQAHIYSILALLKPQAIAREQEIQVRNFSLAAHSRARWCALAMQMPI
ncbi:hypothetical protein BDV11DRAFT_185033, partial [Aspergillus similis]